jgi:hypothetical protein
MTPQSQIKEEMSRGELIAKGALAAGALYGLGSLGPYARRALAAGGGGDVTILNFLLTFEYLQVSLYNRGVGGINDKGEKMEVTDEQQTLMETLLKEEGEHVAALTAMIEKLGGKPVAKPELAFAFREMEEFFDRAGEIETFSVEAYNGALPAIASKEVLELAASIVQVDGRHAATVWIHVGEEPSPEAFELARPDSDAINEIEKFTGPAIYKLPNYE